MCYSLRVRASLLVVFLSILQAPAARPASTRLYVESFPSEGFLQAVEIAVSELGNSVTTLDLTSLEIGNRIPSLALFERSKREGVPIAWIARFNAMTGVFLLQGVDTERGVVVHRGTKIRSVAGQELEDTQRTRFVETVRAARTALTAAGQRSIDPGPYGEEVRWLRPETHPTRVSVGPSRAAEHEFRSFSKARCPRKPVFWRGTGSKRSTASPSHLLLISDERSDPFGLAIHFIWSSKEERTPRASKPRWKPPRASYRNGSALSSDDRFPPFPSRAAASHHERMISAGRSFSFS